MTLDWFRQMYCTQALSPYMKMREKRLIRSPHSVAVCVYTVTQPEPKIFAFTRIDLFLKCEESIQLCEHDQWNKEKAKRKKKREKEYQENGKENEWMKKKTKKTLRRNHWHPKMMMRTSAQRVVYVSCDWYIPFN